MSEAKCVETNQVERIVIPDYDIIWLIPNGDGGASWCDAAALSPGMSEKHAIKYKRVEYVVQLEEEVYLADVDGDPGRTLVYSDAMRFFTRGDAELALGAAQKYRLFSGAEIYEV